MAPKAYAPTTAPSFPKAGKQRSLGMLNETGSMQASSGSQPEEIPLNDDLTSFLKSAAGSAYVVMPTPV